MPRPVLDTSVLIHHWHGRAKGVFDNNQARIWARRLGEIRGTNDILTPVEIEFVAGARSSHDLELFHAFLSEFKIIDDGVILADDWKEARRLASRVPRDGKPRQLGDCLIRAIAKRLRCDVTKYDRDLPL